MSWFNIIKDCGKKHVPDEKVSEEEWLKDKKMPFHIDVGEEE